MGRKEGRRKGGKEGKKENALQRHIPTDLLPPTRPHPLTASLAMNSSID
jgi:hypothetical protein